LIPEWQNTTVEYLPGDEQTIAVTECAMKTKQQTQRKTENSKNDQRSPAEKNLEASPMASVVEGTHLAKAQKTFDHPTARPLQTARLLAMQRNHGNAHVQRTVNKRHAISPSVPEVPQASGQVVTRGPGQRLQRQVPSSAPVGQGATVAQPSGQGATVAQPAQQVAAGPPQLSQDEVFSDAKRVATPYLLDYFQGFRLRCAELATRKIKELFAPYEDSLEWDKTFASLVGLVPKMFGGAGGGALGNLGGNGVALAFEKCLDFTSVGQVKAAAQSNVLGTLSKDNALETSEYEIWENEAMGKLKVLFDKWWATSTSASKSNDEIHIEAREWVRTQALDKNDPLEFRKQANNFLNNQVSVKIDSMLQPVKVKLEKLRKIQRRKKWAETGAVIGAMVGGPIGAIPGAEWGAAAAWISEDW